MCLHLCKREMISFLSGEFLDFEYGGNYGFPKTARVEYLIGGLMNRIGVWPNGFL
jgi:hypothetical protein